MTAHYIFKLVLEKCTFVICGKLDFGVVLLPAFEALIRTSYRVLLKIIIVNVTLNHFKTMLISFVVVGLQMFVH